METYLLDMVQRVETQNFRLKIIEKVNSPGIPRNPPESRSFLGRNPPGIPRAAAIWHEAPAFGIPIIQALLREPPERCRASEGAPPPGFCV